MWRHWVLGCGLGSSLLVSCTGEAPPPASPLIDSHDGGGGHGGEGGQRGEDPESLSASRALCSAAASYAERCDTPVYHRYCEETFGYLPIMDSTVKRAFVTCFEGRCEQTSLSKCYAEAIAAVEPEWIDPEELFACANATGHCTSAVRGQLADCLATAEACEWPFAVSTCWHLATLNEERRDEGMRCESDVCEAWIGCTHDALHRP